MERKGDKTYDGEIERGTAGHLLFLRGHADHETPLAPLAKRGEKEATSASLADHRRRRVPEGGGGGQIGGLQMSSKTRWSSTYVASRLRKSRIQTSGA